MVYPSSTIFRRLVNSDSYQQSYSKLHFNSTFTFTSYAEGLAVQELSTCYCLHTRTKAEDSDYNSQHPAKTDNESRRNPLRCSAIEYVYAFTELVQENRSIVGFRIYHHRIRKIVLTSCFISCVRDDRVDAMSCHCLQKSCKYRSPSLCSYLF